MQDVRRYVDTALGSVPTGSLATVAPKLVAIQVMNIEQRLGVAHSLLHYAGLWGAWGDCIVHPERLYELPRDVAELFGQVTKLTAAHEGLARRLPPVETERLRRTHRSRLNLAWKAYTVAEEQRVEPVDVPLPTRRAYAVLSEKKIGVADGNG